MVDIANFRFTDPGERFDASYARGNALRTDAARMQAGNALQSGNYSGAAGALLGVGDLNAGVRVQQLGDERTALQAKTEKDHADEGAKLISDFATRAATFHEQTGDINQTLAAFDQFAPQLARYDSPEEIAKVREQIAANPQATLVGLGAGAAKQLGYDVQGSGDEVLVIDRHTGKLVSRYRGARTAHMGDGDAIVEIPGQYGDGAAPAPDAAPAEAPAMPASGGLHPDAVWKSIHAQESGGDPTPGDAVGPNTRFGNALGSTQMLPATAEAMARKLGIPWNPALMRENSPKALEYQDKLGRAYFDEGLEKSGGDPAAAAAYYFAGPDPSMHGPKTRAYVDQVMARAQTGSQPYQVASNGETPPPPSGARVIASRPKAPKEREAPSGYTYKPDGSLAFIPGGPADPATKTSAGLKLVPPKISSGYTSNTAAIRQIDEAIAAIRANPHALGMQNFVGDEITQRTDPKGVSVRAAVANIGSLQRHDRSGASVTASETPILKPFIPAATDRADAAITKLQGLRRQYENTNSELEVAYGEDSGYRPLVGGDSNGSPSTGGAKRLSPAEAAKLAPGTKFIGMDGIERTRH